MKESPIYNASAHCNYVMSLNSSLFESQFFPCEISEYLIPIMSFSIRYHYMFSAWLGIGVTMESLDQIVQRMEAPIAFASGDAYSRLSQVKNLEMVMISLLQQLKEEIRQSVPHPRKEELDRLSDELLNLFGGYEDFTDAEKRDRLSRATPLFARLKTPLINLGKAHQID